MIGSWLLGVFAAHAILSHSSRLKSGSTFVGGHALDSMSDEEQGVDTTVRTVKGCTCKSKCEAVLEEKFSCDRCQTQGRCGRFGWKGKWDYCKYDADSSYDSLSFQAKDADTWSKIVGNSTMGPLRNPLQLFEQSMFPVFDSAHHENPEDRVKVIHAQGSVCKFELNIVNESPYTGLLEPGRKEGIVRMSDTSGVTNEDNTSFGFGFRFSRSGVHSGSFLATSGSMRMGFNPFKWPISNHFTSQDFSLPANLTVEKFGQVSSCATQVGISDLAKYSQNGAKQNRVKFPFKLYMVPSQEVQLPDVTKTTTELFRDIGKFPVGTVLFSVYACQQPKGDEKTHNREGLEAACGNPMRLGDMVTKTPCVTSAYGDSKLNFKHQRIEEDWQLNPSFFESYNASAVCGLVSSPNGAAAKCGSQSRMLNSDA